MWTLLGGGDGARMRTLVEQFNASQTQARVLVTTLTWGEPFYTKVMTSTAVGAGPDLATVHLSRMANLIGAQTVRPLTSAELAAAGLKADDFYPRLWQKASRGGTAYAVPLDSHALVMYYNKALLAKAGLLDAEGKLKPIEGMAALTSAIRTVKEKTGMQGVTMESGPNSYLIWRLWLSLLAQRGARVITDGHFSYGKDGEVALADVANWFAKGYASRGLDYPAATSQFMSGKAGFMINGVWEVPSLVAAASQPGAFDYGIVPLPKLYGNASVWGDSHAFAVPNNAGKPIAPAKLAATLKFVAYVSRHSLTWASGGHIPAYVAVAESAPALALVPNASYARAVAANVVYDPEGWYAGAAGPLQASSAKFLPAALSGQLTPAQALSMFEAEAGKLLVRRQPKP
jgi:multiple sugar transport system substrate-binding protein